MHLRVPAPDVPPPLHDERDEESQDERDDDAHAREAPEVRRAENLAEVRPVRGGDAEAGEVEQERPEDQREGL